MLSRYLAHLQLLSLFVEWQRGFRWRHDAHVDQLLQRSTRLQLPFQCYEPNRHVDRCLPSRSDLHSRFFSKSWANDCSLICCCGLSSSFGIDIVSNFIRVISSWALLMLLNAITYQTGFFNYLQVHIVDMNRMVIVVVVVLFLLPFGLSTQCTSGHFDCPVARALVRSFLSSSSSSLSLDENVYTLEKELSRIEQHICLCLARARCVCLCIRESVGSKK